MASPESPSRPRASADSCARASKRPRPWVRRLPLYLEQLEDRIVPAIVSWDGGGNDLNWANRFNWSGDVLPGTADIAVIDQPAITVNFSGSSTVQAVQSTAGLTLASGSLTTTSGASQVSGAFTLRDNAT